MNAIHIYELITVREQAGAIIEEWKKKATFDRAEALEWARALTAPEKQGASIYRDEIRDWNSFAAPGEYQDGMTAAEALDVMNGDGYDLISAE